jgi:hypothetical protein
MQLNGIAPIIFFSVIQVQKKECNLLNEELIIREFLQMQYAPD